MGKLKNKSGFTLAEMLLVVAIIVILSGVAFIAVNRYQRSYGQLERDGIAKEIFVAAQNHLTAAYGAGYLGATNFGTVGTAEGDTEDRVYFFVVNGAVDDSAVIGQMLPFGSIDETVRTGGSYIVRYQKDAGLVLDVFYCTRNGAPEQYNHQLAAGDYGTVLGFAGDDKKAARHSCTIGTQSGVVLGWYGGEKAKEISKLQTELKSPTISVTNAEKLYVEIIDDPNTGAKDINNYSVTVAMRLLVKGLSSGVEHYINVTDTSKPIILDDITNSDGHFAYRDYDDIPGATTNNFIPGENISIQAIAFTTDVLGNIAYSNKLFTNSLFEGIADNDTTPDKVFETAYIGNIRHLENLDKHISNLGTKSSSTDDVESFSISKAEQTSNFSWEKFKTETAASSVTYSTNPGVKTNATTSSSFYPVSPDYALTYDGHSHSISDVAVSSFDDAGLFGSTSSVTEIKNLELLDFNISGDATAGALAGKLTGAKAINVLARNTANSKALAGKITAPTAGGLIGNSASTVQCCAAAVIVNGSTAAGGLIGDATAGSINECYSGGHTDDGSYEKWTKANDYDVTGGTVGGLVGKSAVNISGSYSTCSVSGSTAGGFAGNASGNISNCYATGFVYSTGTAFAFLGEGEGGAVLSGDSYYSAVNIVEKDEGGKKVKELMLPYDGYELNATNMTKISPLDLNADEYNKFTKGWDSWNIAIPYDAALVKYYGGKYSLKAIDEMTDAALPTGYDSWAMLFVTAHYGDWPSPEVFFINND